MEIIVSLVSEMEKKQSGSLLGMEGSTPADSKPLTPNPTEATLLQANPTRCAILYRVILQAAASFLK